MERKQTFMGVTTEYDPVKDRNELQQKAEKNEINPRGYWANLKASWHQMTRADKDEELEMWENERKVTTCNKKKGGQKGN